MRHASIFLVLLAGCAITTDAGDFTDFDLTWSGQPGDLEVDSAPGTVTCDITFDDTLTIIYAGCVLEHPDAEHDASCLDTTPIGDLWSCDAIIPQDGADGDWTVKYAFATDVNGNPYFAYTSDLENNDPVLPTVVPVDSPNGDISPPTITEFSALPAQVTVGESVTCIVSAIDASGIQDTGCTFNSTEPYDLSCISHGGLSCPLDVPADADAGVTWGEVNHFARDTKGNANIVEGFATFTTVGAGGAGGAGGAPAFCDTLDANISASLGWASSPAQTTAYDTLIAEGYVRPRDASDDMGVAVSQNAPTTWDDAAVRVRFQSGEIQAYDQGTSSYRCDDGLGDTTCPGYTADEWYQIVFTVDITNETYDADVSIPMCGDALDRIAEDFAFDNDSPDQSLSYWGLWSMESTIELDYTHGSWTPTGEGGAGGAGGVGGVGGAGGAGGVGGAPTPPALDFWSDWRTATGQSSNAYTDGGKWSAPTWDLGNEVIAATGLGFPAEMANVFIAPNIDQEGEGGSVAICDGWPMPSIGEAVAFRFYMRHDLDHPGSGGDYSNPSHHPVQPGVGDIAYSWAWKWGLREDDDIYDIQMTSLDAGYYGSLSGEYSRGTVLMMEHSFERVSSTNWRIRGKLSNASGTEIDSVDSGSIAANFHTTLQNSNCSSSESATSAMVGWPGPSGWPNTAGENYWGGFAVAVTEPGEWIGTYPTSEEATGGTGGTGGAGGEGGVGGVSPNQIYASQTVCMSPCGVNFNVLEASNETWSTVKDAEFLWDFDDPGSSRPTDDGFIAGHVFELPLDASSPVTFDVTVTMDGQAWQTKTIQVNPPGWPGLKTHCVSLAGGDAFDDCPSQDPGDHYTSVATAWAANDTNMQLLFHRGEDYGTVSLFANATGPFYWGAYGDPELDKPKFAQEWGFTIPSHWRAADLDIYAGDLTHLDHQRFWDAWYADHILILRTEIECDLGGKCGFVESVAPAPAGSCNPDYVSDGQVVVDNTFTGGTRTNMWNGSHGVFMGNEMDRHNTGGHTLRMQAQCYTVIAENDLRAYGDSYDDIQVRGQGKYVLVRDNLTSDMIAVKPQDNDEPELQDFVIIDGNSMDPSRAGHTFRDWGIRSRGDDVIIRNNVVIDVNHPITVPDNTAWYPPPAARNEIYNNTIYSTQAKWTYGPEVETGSIDTTVRNNLMSLNGTVTDCVTVQSGTTNTVVSNNHCYVPNDTSECTLPNGDSGPSYCTDPDFRGTGGADGDYLTESHPNYMLPHWSGDRNSGYAVPVDRDYKFIARPIGSDIDIGAREMPEP